MKKYLHFLFTLILIGCASGKKNNLKMNSKISVKEMQEDLRFVERKLFKMHPDVDWYISKEELHKKFDSVALTINQPLKPNDFFFKIAPILASVRQGHMSLNLLSENLEKTNKKKYKGSKSPFSQIDFLWNNGNLYILKNKSKNNEIKEGSIVLDINGISPQEYYAKFRPSITSDGLNETFIDKWFERKISGYYVSELGILDSINLKINCADSISTQTIYRIFKNIKTEIKQDTTEIVKKDSLKIDQIKISKEQKKAQNDSLKRIVKRNRIYGFNPNNKENIISLNFPKKDSTFAVLKIQSFTGTKYKKAYKEVFETIKNKNIQNLVLDLRGNTGGRVNEIDELYSYLTKDQEYVLLNPTTVTAKWKLIYYLNAGRSTLHYTLLSPFYLLYSPFVVFNTKKGADGKFYYKLKQEKSRNRKENNYEGQLFVLTDGLSFSASSIISSNLKGSKRATFVGNETGGTYNGTVAGRLPILTLPNSKLKWRLGVMTVRPFQQTDEFGRGIKPDQVIIPTLDQIINNEDAEMDWIYDKLEIKE